LLGIAPGVTGGLAFLYPHDTLETFDIPTAAGELDVAQLRAVIASRRPRAGVVERASSMPGQGVASVFKFGQAYGALRAILACLEIPYHLVTPGKWKNYFHLDRDKEKSRALALRLWPVAAPQFSLKKHHGRAEAALIARYGVETIPGLAWPTS
jgi:crossover junction endodeoxyribonuclease RuvC